METTVDDRVTREALLLAVDACEELLSFGIKYDALWILSSVTW